MAVFRWRHFAGELILWAVRWYCRYGIRRDLEGMMTPWAGPIDQLDFELSRPQDRIKGLGQAMADHLVKRKFGWPVDSAVVAADWRARGYSCDPFVDPQGREWNDFVHAQNELVTVAEGRLEVKVAGSRFVAEPGDEVFIPKGALHSVKNVHVTATRWLYGYD